MLTRDIALEDAILDLLDNCVDGILRTLPKRHDPETPYSGYWAKISFDGQHFRIQDNCGGIPWSEHDRTFRMGNPSLNNGHQAGGPTPKVGTYGIGMKRAIFKMGREALIWTQNGRHNYEVPIASGWMTKEDKWDLPVRKAQQSMDQDGTIITVRVLESGTRDRFTAESFKDDLLEKIQSHYAVIIHKGFAVEVNGTPAKPKPILLRFAAPGSDSPDIRPYVFKTKTDGVEVFLAVGLRDPVPDAERMLEGQTENTIGSDYAGWTVICNDRVVLYCNRDELTGWGTAKLPRYHTQFLAISGVVEFRGDPRLLPTTTTKRGLDFSRPIYQKVLDRMRDGLRIFIDFTNRWKARENEAKAHVGPVSSMSYATLKREADKLQFARVKVGLEGEQYKPKLPRPAEDSPDVRISYFRERALVTALAEKIVPDFEDLADLDLRRQVGERSFDFAYDHHLNGTHKKRSG
jgi:hypothetical protein